MRVSTLIEILPAYLNDLLARHGDVDITSLELLPEPGRAALETVLGSAGAAWEMDVAFPRGATDPNAPADVVFSAFSASGTEEE